MLTRYEYLTSVTDRQTVLIGTRTPPHTPTLYCKQPAPPLHLPRHNDLLGLHRLITGMKKVLRHGQTASS